MANIKWQLALYIRQNVYLTFQMKCSNVSWTSFFDRLFLFVCFSLLSNRNSQYSWCGFFQRGPSYVLQGTASLFSISEVTTVYSLITFFRSFFWSITFVSFWIFYFIFSFNLFLIDSQRKVFLCILQNTTIYFTSDISCLEYGWFET